MSSLLSLAYSLTAYQVAVYNSNSSISSATRWEHLSAGLVFLLWKAFILVSRLSAFTLLAAYLREQPNHPWIFCGCLLLHWFLAFIALIQENLNSCRCLEVVFVAALAVVQCFDVALLNLRRRRRNYPVGLVYGLWYGVFIVENVAAAASLCFLQVHKPAVLDGVAAIALVTTTFFLGIAFMLIYYGCAYHKVVTRNNPNSY